MNVDNKLDVPMIVNGERVNFTVWRVVEMMAYFNEEPHKMITWNVFCEKFDSGATGRTFEDACKRLTEFIHSRVYKDNAWNTR